MDSKVLFEDDVTVINEYLKVYPEDINILPKNYGMSPLMYAVLKQRVDVIDCLIKHKCDINFQNDRKWTALHYACSININRDIIERLVSNGTTGLLKHDFGRTPLHYGATYAKDVNIIHLLLFVSDPNSLCARSSNALMIGCQWNKNIEIISALLNVTHDINLQDIHGWTAFHHSWNPNQGVIKFLLSFGADPFIQDNEGITPYYLANEEGKRIIDEFIGPRK